MASQAIPLTLIAPPAHTATGSAVAATAGSSSPPPSTGVTQVTPTAGLSSPASTPSALASPIQAPTGPPAQVPNQIYIHRSPWDTLKLLRQWTCYAAKIFGAAAGLVAAYIALSITIWTSAKDFRDDCRSQNATIGVISKECEKALRQPLSPPPMLSGHLRRDVGNHRDFGRTADCSEALQALQVMLLIPRTLLLMIAITSVFIGAVIIYLPESLKLQEKCWHSLRSFTASLSHLSVANVLRERSVHNTWVPASLAKSAPVMPCPISNNSIAYLWGRLPSQGFPSLKMAMKHASRRERRARVVQWLDLLEELADKEEIPDQYLFMFIDNAIALSLDHRHVSDIEYSETSSILTTPEEVDAELLTAQSQAKNMSPENDEAAEEENLMATEQAKREAEANCAMIFEHEVQQPREGITLPPGKAITSMGAGSGGDVTPVARNVDGEGKEEEFNRWDRYRGYDRGIRDGREYSYDWGRWDGREYPYNEGRWDITQYPYNGGRRDSREYPYDEGRWDITQYPYNGGRRDGREYPYDRGRRDGREYPYDGGRRDSREYDRWDGAGSQASRRRVLDGLYLRREMAKLPPKIYERGRGTADAPYPSDINIPGDENVDVKMEYSDAAQKDRCYAIEEKCGGEETSIGSRSFADNSKDERHQVRREHEMYDEAVRKPGNPRTTDRQRSNRSWTRGILSSIRGRFFADRATLPPRRDPDPSSPDLSSSSDEGPEEPLPSKASLRRQKDKIYSPAEKHAAGA